VPLFDLPLDDLRAYRPEVAAPADFDAFWAETVAAHAPGPDAHATRVDEFYAGGLSVGDVDFAGYDGQRVRGWLIDPGPGPRRCTAVVHYPGYGQGRGYAHQWLSFAAAGFTVLVIDARGQGAESEFPGSTPDLGVATGAEGFGFLTRGVATAHTSYLRRLYVDAYAAVDALPLLAPHVTRKAIVAASQGAGVGLAVLGLRSDVDAALLAVPSFAHFRRALEIGATGSRAEIARLLAGRTIDEQTVLQTLSYFDAVTFAARAHATAAFSVAAQATDNKPSTVFAAYNSYAGPKSMKVWPHNGHESGGSAELQANLRSLTQWHDEQE